MAEIDTETQFSEGVDAERALPSSEQGVHLRKPKVVICDSKLQRFWSDHYGRRERFIDDLHMQVIVVDGVNVFNLANSRYMKLVERPVLCHVDQEKRIHCVDGPALKFADGFCVYALHGVEVSERAIMRPHEIGLWELLNARNSEVFRILIERYGTERYLLDRGAEVIHCDETGMLYRMRMERHEDEPTVMLRLLNSTPEPDGSLSKEEAIAIFGKAGRVALNSPDGARFKEYFLRVPPTMKTAREAVAWTFGMEADEYAPVIES